MRIAFLGLGLIGGSIARVLHENGMGPRGRPSMAAWTPTGDGPRQALAAGVIDEAAPTPEQAIAGAALVVLAGPPAACVSWLARLGGDLRSQLEPGATVTDVASTKLALLEAATRAGVPWVGGHPMAGREVAGFEAADASLFRDRPWVITEAVGDGDRALVRDLATACGSRIVELDAAAHDRLVAAISHLPLLSSVALVEAVAGTGDAPVADWPAAAALAATGWRDTTRLARGDATMGADIVATNHAPIAAALRAYRDRLDEWLALLEAPGGPDADAVRERLLAARARLGAP